MTRSAIALVSIVGVLAVWSVSTLPGEEQTAPGGGSVLVADEPEDETLRSLRTRFVDMMMLKAHVMTKEELRLALKEETHILAKVQSQVDLGESLQEIKREMRPFVEINAGSPLRYKGKTFEEWKEVIRTELDPSTKIAAISALKAFGQHGYQQEGLEVLLPFLHVKELNVRSEVVRALRRMGPGAVPYLIQVLRDEEEHNTVKFSAVGALRSFGQHANSAVPEVLDLYAAEERWFNVALPTLCKIGVGDERVISFLVTLLLLDRQDLHHILRLRAAAALAKVGQSSDLRIAIPELIEVLRSGELRHHSMQFISEAEMAAIIDGLGDLGGDAEDAVPVLREIASGKQRWDFLLNSPGINAAEFARKSQEALEKVEPPKRTKGS